MSPRAIKTLVCVLVPLALALLPSELLPIADLTVVQHRLLAIFLFAMLSWVMEPIPIFATSAVILCLTVFTISDGGPTFLVAGGAPGGDPGFGPLIASKTLMATFAAPEIMLFLGGFFLADAATKYRLDTNLARVMVAPFGSNPSMVMLGLMLVTAVFSMFMSNTACTAMMLAVVAPVLKALPEGDRGRVAFAMAIPTAANIGGIGTPIGTPPNMVGMKYLAGEHAISFAGWMAFAVPFMLILLAIAWWVLRWLYRPQAERMTVRLDGTFLKTPQALTVYLTFALTIGLWVTEELHGMKSSVVALIPIGVFLATKVISAKDLRGMGWDVLWLIAGGFALGEAMKFTGLSQTVVSAIPFAEMPGLSILIVASLATLFMATFMSHTATANLLMPIMAGLATILGPDSLDAAGGYRGLILAVTFAASLGMALPISTPPNAMAHATGMITTSQMAKSGGLICLIGMAMTWGMLWVMRAVGW